MNTEAQVRLKMPRIREGIDNLQGHFDNCVKSARKNSMTNIESFANNQKPKKIHASGSCSSTIVRLEKDIDSDVERSDEEDKKSSDKEDYSGSDIDLDSLSDVALSDFDSDSEEPVSCHSEGNSDEYDDDARWIAYKVEKADPLCYKFDSLLRSGLIPKTGILYKFLTEVVEFFMILGTNTARMRQNFSTALDNLEEGELSTSFEDLWTMEKEREDPNSQRKHAK
ncbi:uncharacterized protein LOC135684298 isoform X2 [Rhopilema esculentum]|uniref:uncharacterized protein LOC135684298 isoform X2 n=1 Tax=Rhopilema esculentum TaxID=499914 RepID=UPI0031D0B254